jgi:hypothetical protein
MALPSEYNQKKMLKNSFMSFLLLWIDIENDVFPSRPICTAFL